MRYHAMIGSTWCLYIFYCLCVLFLAVLTNASSVEDTEGVWQSPSAVIKPTEGGARMLHEENGGPDNNEETGRLKGEVARLRKLTEGHVTEAEAEEEAEKRQQAEEEAAKRQQAEEEAEKRRQAEEEAEKRQQAEEEAEKRQQAEEEAAKRRQAEEEAAKRHQAEEEAEKRHQAEEEAAKRHQSEKDTQNSLKRYNSRGNKGLEFLRILVFQTDELESSVNAAREEIKKFCFLAGAISTSCHEALSDLHAATSRLAVAVNTLGKNSDIEDEPPRGSERKSNKNGQEGSTPFFESQMHGEEEAIPAKIWGVWNWVGALLLIILASVINRMQEAPKEKREEDKIKFHGKNGEKEDQRGSHHTIGSEKSENGLPLNSVLSQGANRNTAPGLVRRPPAVKSEVKTSFPPPPKQPFVRPFLPGPGEESALQLGGTPKQHGVTGPVPFRPPQPVWLNQNGPSPSGPSSDLCHSLLVAENSVAAEKAKEDSAASLGELRNPFLQRWS